MSLDQEFDLNAAPLDPADEAEDEDAPELQPLVIIQYRNRGFPPYLIPPTIVLLAAVVILSYQRQTPLRPLSPTQPTTSVPAPAVTEPPQPERPSPSSVLPPKEIVSAPAETKPKEPAAPVSEPIVTSKDAVPVPDVKPAPEPKPAVVVASKELERPAPEIVDPAVANEKLEPLEADPNPPKNVAPLASPPPSVVSPEPLPPAAPPEPPKPPPVPASPFDLDPVEGLRKVKAARAAAEDAPETANPEEALALARPALARRTAIGFNLPREPESAEPVPDPTPQPNPEVNKEEVEQGIQREAEEKEAERQELETIKSQAKFLEIKETVERAAAQRVPFRNALRRVLKTAPPEKAGELIEDLCDEYGRETLPEITDTVRRMLKRMHARSSRGEAVARMRQLGLPEPMILDHLAHGLDRLRNSRDGPRTKDDVRVSAAFQLLSFSAAPTNGTATPPSPPATTGETTARARQ